MLSQINRRDIGDARQPQIHRQISFYLQQTNRWVEADIEFASNTIMSRLFCSYNILNLDIFIISLPYIDQDNIYIVT